jgi:hypothetical protein
LNWRGKLGARETEVDIELRPTLDFDLKALKSSSSSLFIQFFS